MRLDYSKLGKSVCFDGSVGGGAWLQYSASDLIDTLNIGANYRLRKNVSLGVFGCNLLDEDGHFNAMRFSAECRVPRPRTVGIELAVDF